MERTLKVLFAASWSYPIDRSTARNFPAGWSGEVSETVAEAAFEAGVLASDEEPVPGEQSVEIVQVDAFELGGYSFVKKAAGYCDITQIETGVVETVRGEAEAKARLIELLIADAEEVAQDPSETSGAEQNSGSDQAGNGSGPPTT